MNKDFGLIFNLAAAVGARMPAAELPLKSMRGSGRRRGARLFRRDPANGKAAHLDVSDKRRIRAGAAAGKK